MVRDIFLKFLLQRTFLYEILNSMHVVSTQKPRAWK